jgi:hypothetical protein
MRYQVQYTRSLCPQPANAQRICKPKSSIQRTGSAISYVQCGTIRLFESTAFLKPNAQCPPTRSSESKMASRRVRPLHRRRPRRQVRRERAVHF